MAETSEQANVRMASEAYTAGEAIGKQLGSGGEEAARQAYDQFTGEIRKDNRDTDERLLAVQQGMHHANPRDVQRTAQGFVIDWETEKAVTTVLGKTEPACAQTLAALQQLAALQKSTAEPDTRKQEQQVKAAAGNVDQQLKASEQVAFDMNQFIAGNLGPLAYPTFIQDFRQRRQCEHFGAVVDDKYLRAKILPPALAVDSNGLAPASDLERKPPDLRAFFKPW